MIDITPITLLAPFEAEHEAVNFTRSSGGNAFDPKADLEDFNNDQWRYNYNRDTGIFEGRYIEEQSTRLNTQFSAPTSAEDVTVDNTGHTISFYGSGTMTLSGAHSETIDGTDSVTRTTATFTPSAGTLTITPSGDVEFLQLEEGFATSPISGDGQQVTRDTDIAAITDLDAIDFNPNEGTFVVEYYTNRPDEAFVWNGFAGPSLFVFNNSGSVLAGVRGISNENLGSISAGEVVRVGLAYDREGYSASLNGSLGTATEPLTYTPNEAQIGRDNNDNRHLNGGIIQFQYYPRRLSNAQLQEVTVYGT